MIVLDTNVVSELIRKEPAPEVLAWFDHQAAQPTVITAITVAEMRFGVQSMPEGKRQRELDAMITALFEEHFARSILPFDHISGEVFGVLAANLRTTGQLIGENDVMIAAIVLQHNATVATRNVRHFQPTGVPVVNPFER